MSHGTIYLMRHGQIEQVSPRRFVGQRDLPLDEVGRRQARAQGRRLAGADIVRAVSSDLGRCLETARLVLDEAGLREIEVEAAPDLREISLGRWEGLTTDEVKERFGPEYEARGRDMAGTRPSGGENFEDVARRAGPAFERIAGETGLGRTLVVAHGGVNRVILCGLLGLPLANLFRLEQHYGCLNTIRLTPGAPPTLEHLNIPPEKTDP